MKDRIREIMESRQMTQLEFAKFIQQSPATLSSIFNGRTRPTLNIVEAIKQALPSISTDWLLLGVGDMYVSEERENGAASPADAARTLEPMIDFDAPAAATPSAGSSNSQRQRVAAPVSEVGLPEVRIVEKPARKITEIRVYFDDQTYETFTPDKK